MLTAEGLHVPEMPLFEVGGKAGEAVFRSNGPIWVKVGVIPDDTVIAIVVVPAHCPAEGVKVYVDVPTVEVLIKAGLHVPEMPLFEVRGNAGGVEFWHNGPICVNVGVMLFDITIAIVAVAAHWPAAGVKL